MKIMSRAELQHALLVVLDRQRRALPVGSTSDVFQRVKVLDDASTVPGLPHHFGHVILTCYLTSFHVEDGAVYAMFCAPAPPPIKVKPTAPLIPQRWVLEWP